MKNWILLVFKLLPGLEKRIAGCDRIIERIALSPFGDTAAQYDEILSQMDKKARLVNLGVMLERIKSKLDYTDYFLLCRYAAGVPVSELADGLKLKRGTVYKRLRRILIRAAEILERDGYNEERLEKEYLSLPFVSTLYARLNRRSGLALVKE